MAVGIKLTRGQRTFNVVNVVLLLGLVVLSGLVTGGMVRWNRREAQGRAAHEAGADA